MDAQKSLYRRKLRPSVESLESLGLLSGMAHAVAVHPVALVHAEAIKAVAVVRLDGTIHATVKVSSSSLVVSGSGNLGAVGTASINLHLGRNSPLPTSTLSTKKGQIALAGTEPTLLGGGSSVIPTGPRSDEVSLQYTVVGGTGAYAHSTGSGTLTEAVALGKGDKITVNLTFS